MLVVMVDFLNVFGDNFQKYGIEIDPGAVKYAKENFNLDVRLESLKTHLKKL